MLFRSTLAVTGVTTSGSFTEAVLKVDAIYNNVNDVINIIGISSESYAGYNNLHRITVMSLVMIMVNGYVLMNV